MEAEANLPASRTTPTKKKTKKSKGTKRTSPCVLDTFPHCKKSKSGLHSSEKVVPTETCTKKIIKKAKLGSKTFECYLDHMWNNFSEDMRTTCARIDSLWFNFYLKESSKERVLTWVKKRNIFSKKYVFVPIVAWGHWRLLILCHFGDSSQSETKSPCMLLLDSLQMTEPGKLEPSIRKFVMDIYATEDRPESTQFISEIPLLVPKVPQQTDGQECGYFVLYFINLFLEAAPENFSVSEGYPYFMKKDWFTHESLERFCEQFDNLETEAS